MDSRSFQGRIWKVPTQIQSNTYDNGSCGIQEEVIMRVGCELLANSKPAGKGGVINEWMDGRADGRLGSTAFAAISTLDC